MTRRAFCVTFVLLIACKKKEPPAREYPMSGVVVSVDSAAKTAVIDAGKIDGWMEAMTMEYPVPNPADLKKLAPGKRISATVEVRDLNYTLKNIQ